MSGRPSCWVHVLCLSSRDDGTPLGYPDGYPGNTANQQLSPESSPAGVDNDRPAIHEVPVGRGPSANHGKIVSHVLDPLAVAAVLGCQW